MTTVRTTRAAVWILLIAVFLAGLIIGGIIAEGR